MKTLSDVIATLSSLAKLRELCTMRKDLAINIKPFAKVPF